MDIFTFCSYNYVHNFKSDENFSVILRNKIGKRYHKDSVSEILSSIETPNPPRDIFSHVIVSGSTPPITMGTNSKIPSGIILPVTYRGLSNILEDTYATFYNSASSSPINPKVHILKPDPTTYVKSNSDSISETTITSPINLSDSKILQQICSCIFNYKKYSKDLKRCYGNENHWRTAKDNWDSVISAVQCNFMLNS